MLGTVSNQKTVAVNGNPAAYAYVDYEGANIVVDVPYHGRCYAFLFTNGSVAGRTSNAPLVDSLLATVVLS